jgi:hypothetical protein
MPSAKGPKQNAKQRAKLPAKLVAAIAAKKEKKAPAPKQKMTPTKQKMTPTKQKMMPPKQKSRKKIVKDLSENALADSKSKNKSIRKDGEYEAEEAVKEGAGEGVGMYAPKMKGPYMESNAQEKKNLMNDNPIASRASGGSWMSKHTKSRM